MRLHRRLIIGCLPGILAVCLAPRPARAQDPRRFPQPVRAGDLLGRQVLWPLESQPSLGRVQTLIRRPDGSVDAILRRGGFLGFGTRPVAVPVTALGLLGEYLVMLGLTAAQLDALPEDAGGQGAPLPEDAILRLGLAKPAH